MQVAQTASAVGRSLDSIVVGTETADLSWGLPVAGGVAAHFRAGWLEVAERAAGPMPDIATRLNPSLTAWSPDNPGSWDPHRNDRVAAWVSALSGRSTSETTHVVRGRWGLDSERFTSWWMTPAEGVDRAVGFIWTPDHPNVVARVQWAGPHAHMGGHGTWWVGTPARHWPTDSSALRRLQALWHPDVGDRECRIAFVGADLPRVQLDQAFDTCTMSTSERTGWHLAAMTPDPFRGLE